MFSELSQVIMCHVYININLHHRIFTERALLNMVLSRQSEPLHMDCKSQSCEPKPVGRVEEELKSVLFPFSLQNRCRHVIELYSLNVSDFEEWTSTASENALLLASAFEYCLLAVVQRNFDFRICLNVALFKIPVVFLEQDRQKWATRKRDATTIMTRSSSGLFQIFFLQTLTCHLVCLAGRSLPETAWILFISATWWNDVP